MNLRYLLKLVRKHNGDMSNDDFEKSFQQFDFQRLKGVKLLTNQHSPGWP
jgi:hypothetical protein